MLIAPASTQNIDTQALNNIVTVGATREINKLHATVIIYNNEFK